MFTVGETLSDACRGMFGQLEMELAAASVLAKCAHKRNWREPISLGGVLMDPPDRAPGFLLLIYFQWLAPHPSGSMTFVVTEDLVAHLRAHLMRSPMFYLKDREEHWEQPFSHFKVTECLPPRAKNPYR